MKNLCKAIISATCFLELSGDDVVDPDAAVAAMESIAAELQSASTEEKGEFVAACRAEAALLKNVAGFEQQAAFISELPEAFGLVAEA